MSGVIRQSVRSFLPCRMISCAAAKGMRCENPSSATVIPSSTYRPTASFIASVLSTCLPLLVLSLTRSVSELDIFGRFGPTRSEDGRGGKECFFTCISRCSSSHYHKIYSSFLYYLFF